jgi:hypothetical protein
MGYVINFHTLNLATNEASVDVNKVDPEDDEASVDPEAEELSFENYTTSFKYNLKEGEGTLQVQTVIFHHGSFISSQRKVAGNVIST